MEVRIGNFIWAAIRIKVRCISLPSLHWSVRYGLSFSWVMDRLTCHLRAASIVLHEIMHANVLVSAQHGNRSISDIAIQVDDGSGDERYLEVYGPAMCKTLARTVPKRQNTKATFVRNGITSNGGFVRPRYLWLYDC